MVTDARGTWAEVDLGAVAQNVALLCSRLAPGAKLMAVVKADGYGHGAVPVARAALAAGAAWLGVALAEEGVALRRAGIEAPILVLGGSNRSQMMLAAEADLAVAVFDLSHLETAREIGAAAGRRLRVHLKVDTGMGRIGLIAERFDEIWAERLSDPGLDFEGVFTHFAGSDEPDPEPTRRQLSRLLDLLERLRVLGLLPRELHAANSAAVFRFPGTHFTLVRAGIGLYGLTPYPEAPRLVPAMRWRSEVLWVKSVPARFRVGYGGTYETPAPMSLAAVPVGYADGYRRAWGNRATVAIRGRRYPVVGRVSMDQITVAIPPADPVFPGDPVELMGGVGPSAEELADLADTIHYEIVTGISSRVPRRYVGEQGAS